MLARPGRTIDQELHLDLVGALDHVRVCDDVTVGPDEHAGATATRRRDEHPSFDIGDIISPVAQRDDLDDRRTDPRRQCLERSAGGAQVLGRRGGRPGARLGRRRAGGQREKCEDGKSARGR